MKTSKKRGRMYRFTNAVVPLSEGQEALRGIGGSVDRVRGRWALAVDGLRIAWRDRHEVHEVDPELIIVPTGAQRTRLLRSARAAWVGGIGLIVLSFALGGMYLGATKFAFWWLAASAILGVLALSLVGVITVLASAADTRAVLNSAPVSMRDVATTPAWWLPW